jgi:anti-sigma-K factor RskA
MKYRDPALRQKLAGEYVMGTLPARARARFERLMARDPDLAGLVAEWQERLAPVDLTAPAAAPPERVWRGIEAQLGEARPRAAPPRVAATAPRGWWSSLPVWRGLALGALAAAAALLVYVAVPRPATPPTGVAAILADASGGPAWLALRSGERIELRPVQAAAPAPGRAYELWLIAGGPPRSLGLVPTGGRSLGPLALPPNAALAISLEPAGGSPTGAPTGPVLWQGKILAAS